MDYGASINEAEDPVGASPWGNSPTSSPRHNRPPFGNLGEESPPFRFNPQNSNGFSQEAETPGAFERPGTATTASGTEGDTGGSATQDAPLPEPATGSEPSAASQQDLPEPPAVGGPAEQPAQHGPPSQSEEPRKPPKPQYRLQAKITGLERAGKKDPILRFDVHVSPSLRSSSSPSLTRLTSSR